MKGASLGPREANILIVEDNPGDVRLIEEAFQDGRINNHFHVARDGEQALDFIHQKGEYEGAPRPDIIFLSLRLPRVDGEDVLHEIKHHPALGDVPVIILTELDEDLVESLDLDEDADEDAVIEKPLGPDDFVQVIRRFDDFRLSVVRADDD